MLTQKREMTMTLSVDSADITGTATTVSPFTVVMALWIGRLILSE